MPTPVVTSTISAACAVNIAPAFWWTNEMSSTSPIIAPPATRP